MTDLKEDFHMEPSQDTKIQEQAVKEQCIEMLSKEQEAERKPVIHYIKLLEHFEQIIFRQSKEMLQLKQEYNKNVKTLSNINQLHSELLGKYKGAANTIKDYQEKEEMYCNKLEDMKVQMTAVNAKRELLEKRGNEDCEQIIKTGKQQSDEHIREIAKLESTVKRLEITITSLETMLKLRSDECSALRALHGDTAVIG